MQGDNRSSSDRIALGELSSNTMHARSAPAPAVGAVTATATKPQIHPLSKLKAKINAQKQLQLTSPTPITHISASPSVNRSEHKTPPSLIAAAPAPNASESQLQSEWSALRERIEHEKRLYDVLTSKKVCDLGGGSCRAVRDLIRYDVMT